MSGDEPVQPDPRPLDAERLARLREIKRARDARTGRFVSLAFAAAHKATTIVQTIKRKASGD